MTLALTTRYGLKFQPFRPDIPDDALHVRPTIASFLARVEMTVGDGGFVAISGDPGLGKSVVLRLLKNRLRTRRDILVGAVDHPQSRVTDFYRELGDLFGVSLSPQNRWGGFKILRQRWSDHIATTLTRPVLVIDEAQEVQPSVFSELRLLASKDFDTHSLLCIILAGDGRLVDRLRQPDLAPLASRIRRRLQLEPASPEDLRACLDHLLEAAGNTALMTEEVKAALADHAAGNYRVLMNTADELLTAAAERDAPRIDEKLFFEVFTSAAPKPRRTGRAR